MAPPNSPVGRAIDYLLRRDHRLISLHLIFAIFAGFTLFLTFYHVPWRDEAQAWLLARDLGPWGLFLEARHDGHPVLWHLCLKLVQATGSNYIGMMILNWVFIVGAIWLLFYRSTVPLLARVVLALCPACLMHVSYNARNYAISAALIFLAAVVYRNIEKKPVLFSVLVSMLASTNVYAAAVFVGISLQFVLEQAWSFGKSPFSLHPLFTRYLVPNLILLVGGLLLVGQLAPIPLPGEPTEKPVLVATFLKVGSLLWILFLIPPALALFPKKPGCPRIVGGIPTVLLALIPATLYGCGTRHSFMIVLQVVYFVWIYLDDMIRAAEEKQTSFLARNTALVASLLIVIICYACQPGGFRTAFYYKWDSRRAGHAILEKNLDRPDVLMVSTAPNMTTPLLLYFKNIKNDYGPPPFPPEPMSFADFFYTRLRNKIPDLEELKPLVLKIAGENPSKTIMVVSVDSRNANFNDHDPNYHLIPIYSSPVGPINHPYDCEFYQVFVLDRPATPPAGTSP